MKPEEAIKLLEDLDGYLNLVCDDDILEAINLGKEALKRLKEHREEHIDISFRALPGETTD